MEGGVKEVGRGEQGDWLAVAEAVRGLGLRKMQGKGWEVVSCGCCWVWW